jgi:tripeptide aminopeptidase
MTSQEPISLDEEQAVTRLLRFLSVEGITGREQAIGQEVATALAKVGVPRRAIRFDQAHQRIPLPTQTGNLIVHLPGTRGGRRRLFLTHLDTVPLCAGAQPVRQGDRIKAAGQTALGGDNRTGVGCLVTLAAELLRQRLPHPPLTLLFTVREESGLWGARHVDLADLGYPTEGYNIDGSSPAEITHGAVGAVRWEVEIHGKAAHAGVHPEHGISSSMVAALALEQVYRDGWFGRVVRKGQEGTSNVGVFGGADNKSAGDATNVVTDYVRIRGESRSHQMRFAVAISRAYREAFRAAAGRVTDHKGRKAHIRFVAQRDYFPFRLKTSTSIVQFALSAAKAVGLEPTLRVSNGGLDANWMVRRGVPTITFGSGQRNIHTVGEYVELSDYLAGCRVALALATMKH